MANFPTKTTGSQLLTLDEKQLLTYNNPTNYYVDHTSSLVLAISPHPNDTSIVDKSNNPHVVSPFGTAALSTATSPFPGTQTIFLDGNSDYLSIPDSPDFDVGVGDFTIEMWINFGSVTGARAIVNLHGQTDPGRSFWWGRSASGNMYVYYYYDGSSDGTAFNVSWTPVVDTWYHIALSRDSTNLRLFIDGVQLGSTYDIGTQVIDPSAYPLRIGVVENTGGTLTDYFSGYIDEFRFTKGTARYSGSFAPPTQPFGGGLRMKDPDGKVYALSLSGSA